MENLGLYINELLAGHDCVIVPGFGGFVARPAAAHFSKAGNMLLPPGKSLVFNKNLDNSDGLLAHHLSQKLSISYREASNLINQWVQNSKRQLETHKRLELEKTGILYYSPEQVLLFEPSAASSHEISSFGLGPVKAVKLAAREEAAPENEKTYRQPEPARNRGQRTLTRISVIVSSALLFIFLVLLTARQLPVSRALASLNPFTSKTPAYTPKTYELKKLFSVAPKKAQPQVENNIRLEMPDQPAKVYFVAPDTVHTDKTAVAKKLPRHNSGNSNLSDPFQIVVGCFAVEHNAHKLIDQLQQENIRAGIAGRNPKGLYVVSLAGFTTESLARTKLEQVKQRFPSAWILVK